MQYIAPRAAKLGCLPAVSLGCGCINPMQTARINMSGDLLSDITKGITDVTSAVTKPAQEALTNTALVVGGVLVVGMAAAIYLSRRNR